MAFNPNNLSLAATFSNSRQIPSFFKEPLDKISSSIGEMVWAWNYCHSALHRLFASVVNPQNLAIGFSIWHAIQNDSTQRDMLLKAARAELHNDKKLLKQVEWIHERLTKLAVKRNDVIHLATAVQVSTAKLIPDPISNRPNRVRRLSGEEILSDIHLLRGDLVVMANYIMAIHGKISFDQNAPTPRKPRLKSIPAVQRKLKKPANTRKKPTKK
ncbi:MAG: hypothetical protein JJ900_09755 [Rhodospirillales bacterium]|nr:hypothetical protein [Rhodospirillales bacterium]MBO6787123.1 hypothetical protein [Rhodospirillales bacterium]